MNKLNEKKSIESLYKNVFSIKESLQDAISTAQETSNLAAEFGGEISRVITSQINDYLIPTISKYIADENTPGSVAPLVTFLDSVPLAMTREEPAPATVASAATNSGEPQTIQDVPTLEGANINESKAKLKGIEKLLEELNVEDFAKEEDVSEEEAEEALLKAGAKAELEESTKGLTTYDDVLNYVGGEDADEALEIIADAFIDNGQMEEDEIFETLSIATPEQINDLIQSYNVEFPF